MSCPATRAVPPSAFSSVVSTFTAVVFPAPFGPSREKTVPAGTSRSMPSSTVLSPYAFRSPETAIAEVLMRPLSAPPLSRPCHAPDTITDMAFYLVAPGQGTGADDKSRHRLTARRSAVAPARAALGRERGHALGGVLAGHEVVEGRARMLDGLDDVGDAAGFLHDPQRDAHRGG